MTRLAYILTMPGKSSWDGKWSGDGNTNMVVREVRDSIAERVLNRSFTYSFGDGWVARVEVRAAKPEEKDTQFYGYGWMIDSINLNDRILS